MKVLIIGLGSIAKKHIDSIRKIEPGSEIYALRSDQNSEAYDNVINVYDWTIAGQVDFILISNPTYLHGESILKAIDYRKPLFIEKPIFHTLDSANEILNRINEFQISTYVACVLRFHPVIKYLKDLVNNTTSKIDEVNVYCGSYLPNWRNNSDYLKNYSSNAHLGGGVHLDLIHEMDYLYWIFGKPIEIKSTLRNASHLKITAVDFASYQLIYPDFVASVTLNYFRKQNKRDIELVGPDFIWNGNLLTYTLNEEISDKLILDESDKIGTLYDQQMTYFLNGLRNKTAFENDANAGIEVLKMVLNK